MRCSEVKEKLNAFADHELDEKQSSEVQDHLKSCSACQQELSDILSVNAFLNDFKEEVVSDSLIDKVLSETSGVKRKIHIFRNMAVAASVMIAMLSGVYFGNMRTTEQSTYELALGQDSYVSLLGGIDQ